MQTYQHKKHRCVFHGRDQCNALEVIMCALCTGSSAGWQFYTARIATTFPEKTFQHGSSCEGALCCLNSSVNIFSKAKDEAVIDSHDVATPTNSPTGMCRTLQLEGGLLDAFELSQPLSAPWMGKGTCTRHLGQATTTEPTAPPPRHREDSAAIRTEAQTDPVTLLHPTT